MEFIGELKTTCIESNATKRVFSIWKALHYGNFMVGQKSYVRGSEKILLTHKFQTYLITFHRLESTYREICEQ